MVQCLIVIALPGKQIAYPLQSGSQLSAITARGADSNAFLVVIHRSNVIAAIRVIPPYAREGESEDRLVIQCFNTSKAASEIVCRLGLASHNEIYVPEPV